MKECYIGVCREKDSLETTLKQKFQQEQLLKEEKVQMEMPINHIISYCFQDVILITVFDFVNVCGAYLEEMQLYQKVHIYDLLVFKLSWCFVLGFKIL